MIVPRYYQLEAVHSLYTYFAAKNGNPLLALPTGTGKSVVIGGFLYSIYSQYPGQRVIVATHVKELIAQNYKALMAVWPHAPAGIFSAGLNRKDISYPITFAGVKSIVGVADVFHHIDLLIIDEAHLLSPSADGMYMKLIATLLKYNPKLKVIGLTATWWRTGIGLLTNGDIFTDIAYNLCTIEGFKRLFAENYLVPPVPRRTDIEIDTSELKVQNGEFSQHGLNEITKREEITWKALNESLNKNPDRSSRLVFCTGIEHAVLAATMLKALGLKAEAVHSKMPDNERDDIIKRWRSGEIDTLTNNGIATTGIDHPPLDHIIMLRPTMSVGLWVQMVGRGMRPYEQNGWRKLDCIVSDHGGNARRLGPIDDPYIPKMKVANGGDMPVKICPACDTYNHAAARVCSYCGQPFELKIGYTPKAFEDVIIRSDLPIYETYNVEYVYYTQHIKRNATPADKPTIKAVYRCGLHQFQEFIPIEATGFGAKRARDWWRQRFPQEGFIPSTVFEAMQYVDKLIPPKSITVCVNRKYPEITSYGY